MKDTCTLSPAARAWASITQHPGYLGSFTREQAEGAIPNGTRVRKRASEPGDRNPDGSLGTVLGSINTPPDISLPPALRHIKILYFIEWDSLPRVGVSTTDYKVEVAS